MGKHQKRILNTLNKKIHNWKTKHFCNPILIKFESDVCLLDLHIYITHVLDFFNIGFDLLVDGTSENRSALNRYFPLFFSRYVDDIFAISNSKCSCFLLNIKFTHSAGLLLRNRPKNFDF